MNSNNRFVKINGDIFKAFIISASSALENKKEEINALNVFPVPDGDTGANMSMTMARAANDLRACADGAPLSEISTKAAKSTLYGARGNSGVITSLFFKGIANVLSKYDECDGLVFSDAVESGVKSAYTAVDSPAKGTVLTVSAACADAAKIASSEKNEFQYVLEEIIKAAKISLKNTVNENPTLKKAGVVDAGAMGLVVILKSWEKCLENGGVAIESTAAPSAAERQSADFAAFDTEDIKYAFCTEFIIKKNADCENTSEFKSFLSSIGDSLVFVDDEDIIKVHVHTNDSCLVLQAAQHYGVFENVKIENMRSQHTDKMGLEGENKTEKTSDGEAVKAYKDMTPVLACEKKNGVVAVCNGDGITSIFTDLGADFIVSGGQTMNPSTEDILSAIEKVNAEMVYVLPNNKNIILAATQASNISDKKVFVVPTRSIPQGVAAMLNFNPDADGEENFELMSDSIKEVDTIQLTHAAKDSNFDGLDIAEGDLLAIYNDKIIGYDVRPEKTWEKMARAALEKGKKMISIYFGSDSNEDEAEKCANVFRRIIKNATVDVFDGGQPVYSFLIAAEA